MIFAQTIYFKQIVLVHALIAWILDLSSCLMLLPKHPLMKVIYFGNPPVKSYKIGVANATNAAQKSDSLIRNEMLRRGRKHAAVFYVFM